MVHRGNQGKAIGRSSGEASSISPFPFSRGAFGLRSASGRFPSLLQNTQARTVPPAGPPQLWRSEKGSLHLSLAYTFHRWPQILALPETRDPYPLRRRGTSMTVAKDNSAGERRYLVRDISFICRFLARLNSSLDSLEYLPFTMHTMTSPLRWSESQ